MRATRTHPASLVDETIYKAATLVGFLEHVYPWVKPSKEESKRLAKIRDEITRFIER